MPAKHEVRCIKCRRVLLNPVEQVAIRCFGCRDGATKPQGPGEQWEDLLDKGRQAAGRLTRSQWELGDLAMQVLIGRSQEALENYANRIGVEYNTLREYRRVAAAYGLVQRLHNVSFGHYQGALTIADPERRANVLREAAEGHWSLKRMIDAIQKTNTPIIEETDRADAIRMATELDSLRIQDDGRDLPDSPQLGITNHDTAPVSAAQRVEDILERVPAAMGTPVATSPVDDPGGQIDLLAMFLEEIGEQMELGETVAGVIIRLLRRVYNRDHHSVG